MRALHRIAGLFWEGQASAWIRGCCVAVIVLAAGVALLGLSGWFVTAAGAAGLAGLGIAFDVFRPSAGVRFLALGRTAARYGERLLTHDATLKSLAALRGRLLERLTALPYDRMIRLRGTSMLNRITADVDALDGLPLRLVVPLLAALATFAGTFLALGLLVDWRLAGGAVAAYLLGLVLALGFVALRARRPARHSEAAFQALRTRLMDMMRGQTDLLMGGGMEARRALVLAADRRGRRAMADLERLDRLAGFALQTTGTCAAAGTFAGGAWLAQSGEINAAQVALAFFAMLAMAEAGAVLRRGLADYGRMADAAERIGAILDAPDDPAAPPPAPAPAEGGRLACADLAFTTAPGRPPLFAGVNFAVKAGETLALAGPSGSGKSTLLLIAAGLLSPTRGTVTVDGRPPRDWPEADLRARLCLLPQRSVLMGGTIRETLALAAPCLSDAEAWSLLDAVALREPIEALGGLDGHLGESGAGLSGGERRRLALARALARRPDILLLDEPTEGLDAQTAARVLGGIRCLLPEAAIMVAAHRPAERDWAGRIVSLGSGGGDLSHR